MDCIRARIGKHHESGYRPLSLFFLSGTQDYPENDSIPLRICLRSPCGFREAGFSLSAIRSG